MEAELIGVDDPAWREALERIAHSCFHLPEHAAFAARHHHPGEPAAMLAREGDARLLIPLLLRTLPREIGAAAHWRDATSPRDYSGPVATPDAEFIRRAIEVLPQALRHAGVVSAFVRLDPVNGVPLEPLAATGAVVEHGTSVSIDLTLSPDELWAQTRSNHRRHINRARRDGYTARIDETWASFDDFFTAYHESMERLDSDPFFRHSREYFDDLRETLGGRMHLAIVEADGSLAAGALLIEHGGRVDYHLAATRDAHIAASPTKLLIDFARGWAKERGNVSLQLGGSLRPRDSLNAFKLGFSPIEHTVATWRVIGDAEALARLNDSWHRLAGTDIDAADGFFPPYRRPLPALAS